VRAKLGQLGARNMQYRGALKAESAPEQAERGVPRTVGGHLLALVAFHQVGPTLSLGADRVHVRTRVIYDRQRQSSATILSLLTKTISTKSPLSRNTRPR